MGGVRTESASLLVPLRGADGVYVDIGLALNWNDPSLAAKLAVEAAFSNRAPQPPGGAGAPFLFGEANPNPNLKPTWLATMAGRARPDEHEVVGGVQEGGQGGMASTQACGGVLSLRDRRTLRGFV